MNNDEAHQLVSRIADGDKDSLRRLMSKIGGRVKAIAISILKDPVSAEDVLSYVILKIWQKAERIKNIERPLGFINTIAYNYSLDMKRQQQKFMPLSEYELTAFNESLDLKLDVETVLEQLPEDERQIVLYKVEAGLSFRQIGNIMGMTKKMVYGRYHQAEKAFYKYFGNAGNTN